MSPPALRLIQSRKLEKGSFSFRLGAETRAKAEASFINRVRAAPCPPQLNRRRTHIQYD